MTIMIDTEQAMNTKRVSVAEGKRSFTIDTSVVLGFYLPAEPYKAQVLALLADYTAR